ncbi:hypothetical protein [Methylobacterium sp. WL120]|uniref:hypothetical protein n=1 Tax=Methylobacterium sp. WL120 TaxID=2603887 RepID=UPI0011CB38B1|nr:hypothetical protein [Methylobacterium sp. WL120]TXM69979.1 hypothetical protein FV229_03840 [Methylobacterium sp. WL120]
MSKTTTTEDSGAPWPLEETAANIGRAFAKAAAQRPKPAEPVPAETARLVDEAFGHAEAIALSPNVLPFAKRALPPG